MDEEDDLELEDEVKVEVESSEEDDLEDPLWTVSHDGGWSDDVKSESEEYWNTETKEWNRSPESDSDESIASSKICRDETNKMEELKRAEAQRRFRARKREELGVQTTDKKEISEAVTKEQRLLRNAEYQRRYRERQRQLKISKQQDNGVKTVDKKNTPPGVQATEKKEILVMTKEQLRVKNAEYKRRYRERQRQLQKEPGVKTTEKKEKSEMTKEQRLLKNAKYHRRYRERQRQLKKSKEQDNGVKPVEKRNRREDENETKRCSNPTPVNKLEVTTVTPTPEEIEIRKREAAQRKVMQKIEKMAQMTEEQLKEQREGKRLNYLQRKAEMDEEALQRKRERQKARHAKLSEAEKKKKREYLKKWREGWTDEQYKKHLIKVRDYYNRLKQMNPDKWKEARARQRVRETAKRAKNRELKLAGIEKKAPRVRRIPIQTEMIGGISKRQLYVVTYKRSKLAAETEEERLKRLMRQRLYEAKRRLRNKLVESGASNEQIEVKMKELEATYQPTTRMFAYRPRPSIRNKTVDAILTAVSSEPKSASEIPPGVETTFIATSEIPASPIPYENTDSAQVEQQDEEDCSAEPESPPSPSSPSPSDQEVDKEPKIIFRSIPEVVPAKRKGPGRPRLHKIKPKRTSRPKLIDNPNISTDSMSICDICGHPCHFYTITNHKNMYHHPNFSPDSKRCSLCPNSGPFKSCAVFYTKHWSPVHVQKAREERAKTFMCSECGASYSNSAGLRHHKVYKHSGNVTLPCQECGKVFGNKLSLSNHIFRFHKNKGKHPCLRCEQKSASKAELKVHVEEAHPESYFPCEGCGVLKYTLGTKLQHYRNCAKMKNEKIEDQQLRNKTMHKMPANCEVCDKILLLSSLSKHYQEVHGIVDERFQCWFESCDKSFKNRAYWAAHLEMVHDEDLEKEEVRNKLRMYNVKDRSQVVIRHPEAPLQGRKRPWHSSKKKVVKKKKRRSRKIESSEEEETSEDEPMYYPLSYLDIEKEKRLVIQLVRLTSEEISEWIIVKTENETCVSEEFS
ncbi:putative zinc finger protein [Orchesella cincta]|uniref:Putative zinc finger protein n=1 Tax=Orchesella cincta TaxID=48709 RepID=A0A1D2M5P3_ORCCI|nr:putative zinc finger protein [Orchesella cincta]